VNDRVKAGEMPNRGRDGTTSRTIGPPNTTDTARRTPLSRAGAVDRRRCAGGIGTAKAGDPDRLNPPRIWKTPCASWGVPGRKSPKPAAETAGVHFNKSGEAARTFLRPDRARSGLGRLRPCDWRWETSRAAGEGDRKLYGAREGAAQNWWPRGGERDPADRSRSP